LAPPAIAIVLNPRRPSERALKSATRSAQIPRYVGLSMLHPVNTEPSSHRSAAPTLNLDDGATAISIAARALVTSSVLSIAFYSRLMISRNNRSINGACCMPIFTTVSWVFPPGPG